MSRISSIGPFSAMKLFAVLYGMLGLLIGAMFSLVSILGFMGSAASGAEGSWAFLFGTAAIIIAPILYGMIGAIGGLVMSLLYNVAAKFSGGLEIDLR